MEDSSLWQQYGKQIVETISGSKATSEKEIVSQDMMVAWGTVIAVKVKRSEEIRETLT